MPFAGPSVAVGLLPGQRSQAVFVIRGSASSVLSGPLIELQASTRAASDRGLSK